MLGAPGLGLNGLPCQDISSQNATRDMRLLPACEIKATRTFPLTSHHTTVLPADCPISGRGEAQSRRGCPMDG
ncbi:hypothetical protein EYF80_016843 [Liparis tanakae]|uniref:Uncharacterized protein n=1 Tax=Liparis tanakae TaxID=230148 RepID=A0A4Z2I6H1_9TELE|nr:hypothetical protein EYF80_016843 [Liparis tanakae]